MTNTWGDRWRNVNKDDNDEWKKIRHLILDRNMVYGDYMHGEAYKHWFRSIPFMHAFQTRFLNNPVNKQLLQHNK